MSKFPALFLGFISFVLLPCVIVLAAFYWSGISPEDAKRYHELMADAGVKDEGTGDPYQSKQERKRVQKDAFFMQGQERLRLRILAATAQIVLDHREEETQVIEHMNDVTCLMQEELYYLLPNGREASRQADGRLLIRHADPKLEASWADAKRARRCNLSA